MAKLSLQVKTLASIGLALITSICSSIATRRFDTPGRNWTIPALLGSVALLGQLSLAFVQSKEEEELSQHRKQRMDAVAQSIKESDEVSARIQKEIQSGNLASARKWADFKRNRYGK